jgi:hypothetical protein
MVDCIEEFPPELGACSLGDFGRLEERHVQIVLAWPVKSVSPFVRKSARSARSECRDVPKTRQLIVEGSTAGKNRITTNVHSLRTRASKDRVGSRNHRQCGAAEVGVNSIEVPAMREPTGRTLRPRTRDVRQERRDETVPPIEVRRPVVASQVG